MERPGHDPAWLAECRERAPAIAQAFADRMGEGVVELASPGCPKACGRCVRECAVRHIAADWWGRAHAQAERLAAAETTSRASFTHNGVTYATFGRA